MTEITQIKNVNTGEIFFGKLDEELVGVKDYPYRKLTKNEASSYALSRLKTDKTKQLEIYYDSSKSKEEVVNVRGKKYKVVNDAKTRDLLLSKANILQLKIDEGLTTKKKAIFSFEISDGVSVDLTVDEIRKILFFLDDARQSKFNQQRDHKKNLQNLKTKKEIENYDIS